MRDGRRTRGCGVTCPAWQSLVCGLRVRVVMDVGSAPTDANAEAALKLLALGASSIFPRALLLTTAAAVRNFCRRHVAFFVCGPALVASSLTDKQASRSSSSRERSSVLVHVVARADGQWRLSFRNAVQRFYFCHAQSAGRARGLSRHWRKLPLSHAHVRRC